MDFIHFHPASFPYVLNAAIHIFVFESNLELILKIGKKGVAVKGGRGEKTASPEKQGSMRKS